MTVPPVGNGAPPAHMHALGLQTRNSAAAYLYTRQRRAQRLRSQLRCDMYPFLCTHFLRTRPYYPVAFYLEPGESLAPRLLRICTRYCRCRWVDGPGHSFAADSVEHFLLDCVYEGVGRRRQKLWKDIGALGADAELAPSVAVVTGILSQVAAPRDVVGAIPDAQRLVLLRLLLDGDLKDGMPEGCTSVHETPLCGPALAHARMRELVDGFLCDPARLREAFFRHWGRVAGGAQRQAARDYNAQLANPA